MNYDEMRNRAEAWPEGSAAREAMLDAARELWRQDWAQLREAMKWLDREWMWLESHKEDVRHPAREERWLDALSRSEPMFDDLEGTTARERLDAAIERWREYQR